MKKYLVILLTAVFGLLLTGCTQATRATINVKVTKLLIPQSGVSVYMYNSSKWNNSESFRIPFHATKVSVTNKEGIAIFELGRLDLEVIDSQSTFYFATFAEDEKTIIGSTAVTIKSGDKKDVEIYLL